MSKIKYEADNPAHDAAIAYAFRKYRKWCDEHSYDEILELDYTQGFLDGYNHVKVTANA